MDKQAKKRSVGKCQICQEPGYSVLDVHRITPGSPYQQLGTVVLCANCHRRCHADEIIIHGWRLSTAGKRLLHYQIENQEYLDGIAVSR